MCVSDDVPAAVSSACVCRYRFASFCTSPPTRISQSNKGGGLFGRLKADGPKEQGPSAYYIRIGRKRIDVIISTPPAAIAAAAMAYTYIHAIL